MENQATLALVPGNRTAEWLAFPHLTVGLKSIRMRQLDFFFTLTIVISSNTISSSPLFSDIIKHVPCGWKLIVRPQLLRKKDMILALTDGIWK